MFDLEKEIRNSKEDIPTSSKDNPHEIYQSVINQNKIKGSLFNGKVFLKGALGLSLIVILVLSLFLIFSKDQINLIVGNPNGNLEINGTYSDEIEVVGSIEKLRNLVSTTSIDNGGASWDDALEGPTTSVPVPGDNQGDNVYTDDALDSDLSYTTNVQVEGIDEADIVKVNGNYIYYVTTKKTLSYFEDGTYNKYSVGENALFVLKKTSSGLVIANKLVFDNSEKLIAENDEVSVKNIKNYRPYDLFYLDKYIVLNVGTTSYDCLEYKDTKKTTFYNYSYYNEYYIIDINTLETVTRISVPGNLISSRLINNELYIISNYSVFDNNVKNTNQYLVPQYGIDDEYHYASLQNVFYCPGFGGAANRYVVIFKITLGDEIKIEDSYFLSSQINNVYVSTNAIYLIKNNYSKNNVVQENDNYTSCNVANIMIINLSDGLMFDGIVRVDGSINDKYWVDEYDGTLRVASTGSLRKYKMLGGIYEYDVTSEVFNAITIFQKNDEGKWQQIGKIQEGLGLVGESMKSARFNGTKATIVTFRQTDPLYYIDLTDPTNPVITSELKVSGYTVYQHPYKDNYVIGIGYDATSTGTITGYKVALFDISDSLNVKEVGNPILFNNSYYIPEVLSNPKALFLDLKNNLFGFAINSSNKTTAYNFITFKIDLSESNPLSIFHITSRESISSSYYNGIIQRMVFIGDSYYVLGTDRVYEYKLINEDFVETGEIELK